MSEEIVGNDNRIVYKAPVVYIVLFFLLLVGWTIFCIFFLGSNIDLGSANPVKLFMVGFVIFYTWYFSVAISYKIEVDDKGKIRLTSFRRVVNTDAKIIPFIEGPKLPIGFLRFRLEREKGYLFCIMKDKSLKKVLSIIRKANPAIRFKDISI